jgi:hypothetical protein
MRICVCVCVCFIFLIQFKTQENYYQTSKYINFSIQYNKIEVENIVN